MRSLACFYFSRQRENASKVDDTNEVVGEKGEEVTRMLEEWEKAKWIPLVDPFTDKVPTILFEPPTALVSSLLLFTTAPQTYYQHSETGETVSYIASSNDRTASLASCVRCSRRGKFLLVDLSTEPTKAMASIPLVKELMGARPWSTRRTEVLRQPRRLMRNRTRSSEFLCLMHTYMGHACSLQVGLCKVT